MMTAGVRKMLCLNDMHDWNFDTGLCRECDEKMPDIGGFHARVLDLARRRAVPPYVTVAECGHCFEDVGYCCLPVPPGTPLHRNYAPTTDTGEPR